MCRSPKLCPGMNDYNEVRRAAQKLLKLGLIFAPRDPNINTNYQGKYMLTEPFIEGEPYPTTHNEFRHNSSAGWRIVSEHLEDLCLRGDRLYTADRAYARRATTPSTSASVEPRDAAQNDDDDDEEE